MKKRILLILSCCLTIVLLAVPVFAEENQNESGQSSLRLASFNVKDEGDHLKFTFSIKNANESCQFQNLHIGYDLLNESGQFQETVSYDLSADELTLVDDQYQGSVSKHFTKNGIWTLDFIEITDSQNQMYSLPVDEIKSLMSNNNTLVINDVRIIKAPVIKEMSFVDDLSNPIDASTYLTLKIDASVEKYTPSYVLYYYSTKTDSIRLLTAEYDKQSDQYLVTIPSAMKYQSDNFKFLCAETYCSDLDNGPQNSVTQFQYFTTLSKNDMSPYMRLIQENTIDFDENDFHYGCNISNMDLKMNYSEDNHNPEIIESSMRWDSKTIIQPGVAKFHYQVTDFGGSQVTLTYVIYELNNQVTEEHPTNYYIENIADNTVMNVEIPFNRYDNAQESFRILGIYVEDSIGKCNLYIENENSMEKICSVNEHLNNCDLIFTDFGDDLKFQKFQNYDEYLYNSDKKLIEKLSQSSEGKTYVIDYEEKPIISKEVFQSIQGKDITLIFDSHQSYGDSGVQWVINGKDITYIKDIDLKTDIQIKNIKVENDEDIDIPVYNELLPRKQANQAYLDDFKQNKELSYYANYLSHLNIEKDDFYEKFVEEYAKYEQGQIVFAKNGQLPGKMKIRYNPDYTFRGYIQNSKLNCYYVNNDQYELIQEDIQKSTDGCYEFDIVHNSTYVLSVEKLMKSTEDNEEEDPRGNHNDDKDVTGPDVIDKKTNNPTINDHKEKPNTATQTTDSSQIFLFISCIVLSGMIFIKLRKDI